jgi:hypothetical protein
MISQRWIDQQAIKAIHMRPSPEKEALLREIDDARKQRAEQLATVEECAKMGFYPNEFEGLCVVTGATVLPHLGFVRRMGGEGQWEPYTWEAAVNIVNAAKTIREAK